MNDCVFDNMITLTDEKGNDVHFEFLDLVEYEGEEYVVLLPTEDDGSGEVVILRIDDEDGDSELETYVSVEDEDTMVAVFKIFREKFKEAFNFVDEDDF